MININNSKMIKSMLKDPDQIRKNIPYYLVLEYVFKRGKLKILDILFDYGYINSSDLSWDLMLTACDNKRIELLKKAFTYPLHVSTTLTEYIKHKWHELLKFHCYMGYYHMVKLLIGQPWIGDYSHCLEPAITGRFPRRITKLLITYLKNDNNPNLQETVDNLKNSNKLSRDKKNILKKHEAKIINNNSPIKVSKNRGIIIY